MKDFVRVLNTVKEIGSTLIKQERLTAHFSSIQTKVEDDIIYKLFNLQFNYKINSYLADVKKLQPNFLETLYNLVTVKENGKAEEIFTKELYNKLLTNYRFKKQEYIDLFIIIAKECSCKDELDYYIDAVTRRMVLGVALISFNKSISKFGKNLQIDKFEYMAASNMANSKIDYSNAYVSVKKDGVNCTYVQGKFYTRNGGDIVLPHMEEEIATVFKDYVIFGELVSTTRQASSGIVNSALKMGLNSKLAVDSLRLFTFDILPLESFLNKDFSNLPFTERLKRLEYFSDGNNYSIIKHHKVTSLEEVYKWNDYYVAQGEEGIIANDAKQLFEFNRSKLRAKIKAEIDGDFRIVGYTPHDKQPDWLGSFVVETSDGIIKTRVGSGLTEEERKEYFRDIDNIIGKICTVTYNAVDSNTNSLFLPIFKTLREDKTEADSYNNIINNK